MPIERCDDCRSFLESIDIHEGKIIVLPQVRTRMFFNGHCNDEASRIERDYWESVETPAIERLAESILNRGLLFPPILAIWDLNGFESYCNLLNQIINPIRKIQPDYFKPNYPQNSNCPNQYLVLVAGHRRILALRKLFIDKRICAPSWNVNRCTIFCEPDADYAIGVQLEENNTQQPIRQWCELAVLGRLYRHQRNLNGNNLTREKFVQKYHISIHALSAALNLLELPAVVQENILSIDGNPKKTIIPKDNVRELHYLMEVLRDSYAQQDVEKILCELLPQATQPYKSFRLTIERIIQENSGQQTIFNLTPDTIKIETARFISQQITKGINSGVSLLECISRLVKQGLVSPETPFSSSEARSSVICLHLYLQSLNGLLAQIFIKSGESLTQLTKEIDQFHTLYEHVIKK